MDLLMEIKNYLKKLSELGLYQGDLGLATLEIYAEQCFKHRYKNLTKYISAPLAPEIQKELKEHIDKIKEIIKNEK